MNLKKILFLLFSAFLAYRSVELYGMIMLYRPEEISFVFSIIAAFVFNLFITGVFAFVSFVFEVSRLLPAAYYEVRNPRQLISASKLLGLDYFKMALLAAFWGREKNKKKFFGGTANDLEQLSFQSKQAEFGHLLPLSVLIGVSALLLICGYWLIALITTVINIILNFYPVLLQRYHRLRIARIRRISERKMKVG